MGAYENVPILHEGTSAAGKAWAEVASTAGVALAEGIVARDKAIREAEEKENKRLVDIQRDVVLSEVVTGKEVTETVKKAGKGLQFNFAELIKNSVARRHYIKNALENKDFTLSSGDVAELSAEHERHTQTLAEGKDAIEKVNNWAGEVGGHVETGVSGTEGYADTLNPNNNDSIAAWHAINQSGTPGDRATFGKSLYEIVVTTSLGGGPQRQIIINTRNPSPISTIPESSKDIDAALGGTIFTKVDNNTVLNPRFINQAKEGEIAKKNQYTEPSPDGESVNIITTTPIKKDEIIDAVANVGISIYNGYTYEQQVAAIKNTCRDMYVKNRKGDFIHPALTEALKKDMETHTLESFKYPERGSQEGMGDEQKIFALKLFGRLFGHRKMVEAQGLVGKDTVTVKKPPPNISRAVTNHGDSYIVWTRNLDTGKEETPKIVTKEQAEQYALRGYKKINW